MKTQHALGLGMLICIIGFGIWGFKASSLAEGRPVRDMVKGITLDSRGEPPIGTFEELKSHGVTHISVVPFGWQEAYNSPEVHMNPQARWYSEGDHGIAALAEESRKHGMKVIIKPHIWLRNSAAHEFSRGDSVITLKWRDGIEFETEADWAKWESSYRSFILHYARLGEDVGADMICIGTELASTARKRPQFWRSLIKEVRKVYTGKITYAANWYKEYEDIEFWDGVDYIGIQAYFPVSKKEKPGMEDLTEGWKRHHEAIKSLQVRFGKPVLFTEIGYRSVSYAAERPWVWPNRNEQGGVEPDYKLQADLYEAFFRTFWNEEWVSGSIIWKWHPESDRGNRRPRDLDFTPQGKPAARVMTEWYNSK